MATYERCAGEHVAERIRPAAGSDEEARLEELVASGSGWRRVDDPAPGETKPEIEPETSRPSQSANKAAWVDWVVSQGVDREQAEDLTKAELIELADNITAAADVET